MATTKDPDDILVVLFKHHAVKNEAASIKEGRPIFDDQEICEIRIPGSRNISVFPATAFSHWVNDPQTGEQTRMTYAERFSRQYQQFKMHHSQTIAGTPLAHAPFLTEARRAELRALNIYTAEQLAAIDGQELKNLGSYGRDLKNKAQEFIADSKKQVPNLELQAELDVLRARNMALEEDLKAARAAPPEKTSDGADGDFENMTIDQLRDFITTQTGHAPHGTLGKKTLIRMAQDATQKVT